MHALIAQAVLSTGHQPVHTLYQGQLRHRPATLVDQGFLAVDLHRHVGCIDGGAAHRGGQGVGVATFGGLDDGHLRRRAVTLDHDTGRRAQPQAIDGLDLDGVAAFLEVDLLRPGGTRAHRGRDGGRQACHPDPIEVCIFCLATDRIARVGHHSAGRRFRDLKRRSRGVHHQLESAFSPVTGGVFGMDLQSLWPLLHSHLVDQPSPCLAASAGQRGLCTVDRHPREIGVTR